LVEHHGFLVVVIRPAKPLGLGFAGLLLCVLWAQGATQSRWYLGLLADLRDQQALGCHAHPWVGAAPVLVVPCSASAGRDGLSGLGAAPLRHPGAAGRRATADLRVATHSHLPFGSFISLPILVHLMGIHRHFIARCYRGGCPAVTMCKAESCTTAAGFILQTVKRRRAPYKLPGGSAMLRLLSYP
jgi:hypothetical protein